jgi:hypothetical protein
VSSSIGSALSHASAQASFSGAAGFPRVPGGLCPPGVPQGPLGGEGLDSCKDGQSSCSYGVGSGWYGRLGGGVRLLWSLEYFGCHCHRSWRFTFPLPSSHLGLALRILRSPFSVWDARCFGTASTSTRGGV